MYTSIQNSFSGGELSPSILGRTDLGKFHAGAFTMRNFFLNYRGGASSRAGTAFVGCCKQGAPNSGGTATSNPPRDIPFQFNINQGYVLEFGDQYMRIKSAGAYVVETGKNITAATNTNPLVLTSVAHGFLNNQWVYISGMGGMTQLNGLTFIVINKTADTFQLTDLFGNTINSTSYGVFTSGGTAARIYTVTTSPYAAIDLPYLKYTQSADTMTLCCVNQDTGTEYPSYELVRNGNTNWVFTADSFASSIAPPAGVASAAASSTTPDTWYGYVVTSVNADGEESIASSSTSVENNNIAIFAGSNTVTWNNVVGAVRYNVYKATPSYSVDVPVSAQHGFAGYSFGGIFTDTNITADFTITPPEHTDPFARGQTIDVTPTAVGSGYTQAGVSYTITTANGTGLVIIPIVVNGTVPAYIIQEAGENYAAGDTIAITGDGTGATADLVFGPLTGTYPSVPAYFQQRRIYANTQNNPDTYYTSRPGLFNNMDSSVPTVDNDAIVGTPWSQQINGIQFMVPMTGGLVILTGLGAWQLTGGTNVAITPANQTATSQAYNGCNNKIQPVVINYDILYVQSKGSIVRDLSYNFFVNIYTGADTTELSNQLFYGHQMVQWCYAEESYKLVWLVRDDGTALSLTYLKEQEVKAWTRHDTNGLYQCVCSVTEPPTPTQPTYVDAVYWIVKRYVRGHWVYYSERMDNRIWANVEQAWCVDCGLQYPMNYPNAVLTPAAADGTNNITNTLKINGGSGYTNPTAEAVDDTGVGTGATFTVAVAGGSILSVTPVLTGSDYTAGATRIVINDPTGDGAEFQPVITNYVNFTASSSVFNAGMVDDIIRVGGGKATIVAYTSGTQVTANITQPITATLPNDPNLMPIPANYGQWSIGTPTTTITGLNHLEGLEVAILADGSVSPSQTVMGGSITLPLAASQITIGLPYTCQLQTMYLDVPQAQGTMQGKRKNIQAIVTRMEASRGIEVGTNQPDASTQPNYANVPWTNMKPIKDRRAAVQAGVETPLLTGDEYTLVPGDWNEKSQMAFQQRYPLPANVLACVCFASYGDSSG